MIQYLCAKVLIDSQTEKMYGVLGSEPAYAQQHSEMHAARKTHTVTYSERLGKLLLRIGEQLLRSASSDKNIGVCSECARQHHQQLS